ncbi:hypothetical protein BJ508DRAFT_157211 [Ascobolus immersus RN42]|uniref:Uncharacterized protein n=1 Tax=Ascobolus immersus RN42 TaxID=1160509 RepID=A0A3N4HWR3_ASCIM|nr:hypothetical protein BJ508DRAFT_157211 [Ascobolus immersus RN42]
MSGKAKNVGPTSAETMEVRVTEFDAHYPHTEGYESEDFESGDHAFEYHNSKGESEDDKVDEAKYSEIVSLHQAVWQKCISFHTASAALYSSLAAKGYGIATSEAYVDRESVEYRAGFALFALSSCVIQLFSTTDYFMVHDHDTVRVLREKEERILGVRKVILAELHPVKLGLVVIADGGVDHDVSVEYTGTAEQFEKNKLGPQIIELKEGYATLLRLATA